MLLGAYTPICVRVKGFLWTIYCLSTQCYYLLRVSEWIESCSTSMNAWNLEYSHDFVTLGQHWLVFLDDYYCFWLSRLASLFSIFLQIIINLSIHCTPGESFSSFNLKAILFLSLAFCFVSNSGNSSLILLYYCIHSSLDVGLFFLSFIIKCNWGNNVI